MPPVLMLTIATGWRNHVYSLWREWEERRGYGSQRERTPTALRRAFAKVLRAHDALFTRAVSDAVAEECLLHPATALAAWPWADVVPVRAGESFRTWRRRVSAVRSRVAALSPLLVLAADAPTLHAMLAVLPAAALEDAELADFFQERARELLPDSPDPRSHSPVTRVATARARLVERAVAEARATATQTDVVAGLARAVAAVAEGAAPLVGGWSREYALKRFASEVVSRVQRSVWWSNRTSGAWTDHA